jgi:hypothetical protein
LFFVGRRCLLGVGRLGVGWGAGKSARRFNVDEPHAIGGVSQTDDGWDSVLDDTSVVLVKKGRNRTRDCTTGREILYGEHILHAKVAASVTCTRYFFVQKQLQIP